MSQSEKSELKNEPDEFQLSTVDEPSQDNIPAESVEILEAIGINLRKPQEVARFASRVSISGCPYPSPDMLFAYDGQKPGFSDKIIDVVDTQREKRQSLDDRKHQLEVDKVGRQENRLDRAQRNTLIISVFGLVLSVVAALAHVPITLCCVIALISVGGPNAATVLSRIADKWKT